MNRAARVGCVGDLLVEFVATSRNGRHKQPGGDPAPTLPALRAFSSIRRRRSAANASSSAVSATTPSAKSCCNASSRTASSQS